MTIVFPHKPALPSILPILVTNVTSCSGAQARSWQAGSSQFGEGPPRPLRPLIPTESLGFEYSRLLPRLSQQLLTGLRSGPTPVLLTKYKQEHITRRLPENLPCSHRLLDKPPPEHGLQGPACAPLPSLPPKSTCRPLCISGNAPRRHLPRSSLARGFPPRPPGCPRFAQALFRVASTASGSHLRASHLRASPPQAPTCAPPLRDPRARGRQATPPLP